MLERGNPVSLRIKTRLDPREHIVRHVDLRRAAFLLGNVEMLSQNRSGP